MPIIDALIISGIVLMFIVFGAVLAWGEYQTRNLQRPVRQGAEAADKKYGSTTTFQAKTASSKELKTTH
ncbi:MAG: hypothetical protein ABSE67_02140 [Xanthobacteraceae bacterium]|jgi:hypothetical protein